MIGYYDDTVVSNYVKNKGSLNDNMNNGICKSSV
jgi:hypothetical protein